MSSKENYFCNDYVHMYMSEITSKIVARSGLPSDRFHIGKIILQSLQDDPHFVMQIDASIGKSETNGEVLKRCIQCAIAFKAMGLKEGDVIALMAPNHLDLAVPLYTALFLGIMIVPVDRLLTIYELRDTFEMNKPKVVFCQSENLQDIMKGIELSGVNSAVITFDRSRDAPNFASFLDQAGDNIDIQNFKVADFNPEETIALLIPTSGTTGLPKSACLTHKNLAISMPYFWCPFNKFPSPISSVLLVAPVQWLSALINYILGPFMKYTRIQTPLAITPEHTCEIIREFKPKFIVTSPTMMTTLAHTAERVNCDLSCFDVMYFGGSAVPPELITEVKKKCPMTLVTDVYGLSELASMAFIGLGAPKGSSGKRLGYLQYKLVDIETNKEINEPNKSGELWLKIPGAGFKGYYNRPEETAAVMSEDGWFKTGDVFYRDEHWYYYFVDRFKLLLKYKNNQISPVELESVIRQHPGVLDVAVTGLPDPTCGELAVACVVKKTEAAVSAKDIQDLVKAKLSDAKQLRGGVIFMKELPLTASTKIHRRKLKEMVIEQAKR